MTLKTSDGKVKSYQSKALSVLSLVIPLQDTVMTKLIKYQISNCYIKSKYFMPHLLI